MRSTNLSSLLPSSVPACIAALLVLASCGGEPSAPGGPDLAPVAELPAAPSTEPVVTELHPDLIAAQELMRAGRIAEARPLLESVPEEDPSYLLALHDLAAVYTTLGENRAALETLTRLTSIETDNPQLFLALGWAQYREGRLIPAEVSALRALELDPDSIAARYDVAFFRLAHGRTVEATQAYYRAMRRDFAMEYVVQAREHLLMLQRTRPDYPDVHFVLAFFANAIGNHEEEVEELERYLASDPQGPVAETARRQLEEARKKAVS